MPNRNVHTAAGIGTAWLGGYLMAPKDMTPDDRPLYALGLTFGGWLGSRMPDMLDPPTHPGHRSYAHGLVAAGAVAIGEWMKGVAHCRSRAATLRAEADVCDAFLNVADAQNKRAWANFWIFAAGAVQGFGLGYASHLALDALTARSLPVIG
jgi:hypothetical protein